MRKISLLFFFLLLFPYRESHAKEMSSIDRAQDLYHQAHVLLSHLPPTTYLSSQDKKDVIWEGKLLVDASHSPVDISTELGLYASCLRDIRVDQLYEWECEPGEYSSLTNRFTDYVNLHPHTSYPYVIFDSTLGHDDKSFSIEELHPVVEEPHVGLHAAAE